MSPRSRRPAIGHESAMTASDAPITDRCIGGEIVLRGHPRHRFVSKVKRNIPSQDSVAPLPSKMAGLAMLNVYLFIELLKAADPSAVIAEVQKLDLPNCQIRNAVQLADDKLVAHVDCKTGEAATRVVLDKFMSVEGIVQTNIIAVVHPKNR
jgi:hypothetical protein